MGFPVAVSAQRPSSLFEYFFSTAFPVYSCAALLRLTLLLYGLYQDAFSPLKYTDIDYLVFTDAARAVRRGGSPYDRATYRYTPLLAWLLFPTALNTTGSRLANAALFAFGKVLFALADMAAGFLLERTLLLTTAPQELRARALAAFWLLNPMVAVISTRGSAEGLLAALTAMLTWAVLSRRVATAGIILGLGVHFKIYPFIYAPAVLWWMDREAMGEMVPNPMASGQRKPWIDKARRFVTKDRIVFGITSLVTFAGFNALMLVIYGTPFLQHTYNYHLTRLDHRHNFSPYNILLYLSSSSSHPPPIKIESVAFLPQLLLSLVLLPLCLAKKSLPHTFLAQTFAFVSFNKVCTSQYFLWYLVFLPLCLPSSSPCLPERRAEKQKKGPLPLLALGLWVAAQALWLWEGYGLEFLGESTFLFGIWGASLLLFGANCWLLGIVVQDAGAAKG